MGSSDNGVEYDPEKGVYRASYEESADSPSIALVEAVAAIEGCDPTALDPLGDTIDVDALNTVVHHSDGTRSIEVTFPYEGYRVTIRSDGAMEVLPIDPDHADPDTAG